MYHINSNTCITGFMHDCENNEKQKVCSTHPRPLNSRGECREEKAAGGETRQRKKEPMQTGMDLTNGIINTLRIVDESTTQTHPNLPREPSCRV